MSFKGAGNAKSDDVSRAARVTGFTLNELVFAMSLGLILIGFALPVGGDALNDMRARGAARYLAARVSGNRLLAINRSRAIGLRFVAGTADYQFTAYMDGNANGIRTTEIQAGVDVAMDSARELAADFHGVRFGLAVGLPDVDGVRNASPDGVRIGTARILTMNPDGTATSGTLYLMCGRSQYAVRVLGATGRTRVLKYERGSASWVSP